MRKLIVALLATVIAVPAFAMEEPKTDDQKAFYAVGVIMARQLSVFNLSPAEQEMVKQGIADGLSGKKLLVDVNAYKQQIQKLAIERRDAEGAKLAAKSGAFIDKAAKEKGAVKTASGLVFLSLKEGSGAHPAATDKVKVNYRGTLIDGKEFDSSAASGKPAEFQLDQVIKCWGEGVQLMKPGGKARLVCPSSIAYGDRTPGIIPANATLVFDVELLEIVK